MLQFQLAVVATTHRIQTGPSAIPDQPPGEGSAGELPGNSSVCPGVRGSTHQVLYRCMINLESLCNALAVVLVLSTEAL